MSTYGKYTPTGGGSGGGVTGPGSSTAGAIASFANTSGSVLQDSGLVIASGLITPEDPTVATGLSTLPLATSAATKAVSLQSGTNTGTGDTGAISITTGASSAGKAGGISITAGTSSTASTATAINAVAIAASSNTGAGRGGNLSLTAGSAANGSGGSLSFFAGSSATTGGGGPITISSGAGTGGSNGGNITITAGASATNTNGQIAFTSGNTNVLTATPASNLVAGNRTTAPATTATAGFLYIPCMAGAPTGTPSELFNGGRAIVFDTANNKLWVYNGSAWVGVVLS